MGVLQYAETSASDYPVSWGYIPGEWIRREKENAVAWKRVILLKRIYGNGVEWIHLA